MELDQNHLVYAKLLKKHAEWGIWDRNLHFIDSWHNTDIESELCQRITKNMGEVKMRSEQNPMFDKLHIAQMVLTGQFGPGRILRYLFAIDSPRVKLLAQKLHKEKELMLFVRDNMDEFRINCALLDFVDYQPALIRYLIMTNIDEKLIIKKCWMDDIDFTEDVKKLVTRGNSLLVADPIIELCFLKKELEKACEDECKNFTNKVIFIVYKYGENGPLIAKGFPLIYNLPILVTYDIGDQKLHKDALKLMETKLNYSNMIVGVFANGQDRTVQTYKLLKKSLVENKKIVVNKKALGLKQKVDLVTVIENTGRGKLLVKNIDKNQDCDMMNYMSHGSAGSNPMDHEMELAVLPGEE